MNDSFNIHVGAEVSGDDKVTRLADSMDRVVAISEKAAKSTGEAFAKVPQYLANAESAAGRAAKTMSELAAAGYVLKASIAGLAGSLASSASSADIAVNSYRGLRLALSAIKPEIFGTVGYAAGTLAVGLLVEKTLALANARGKVIEQQSLIAASKGLSFGDVERLSLSSRFSGGDPSNSIAALSSLRGSIGSSKTQDSLGALNIPDYARGSASPELLAQIARGLSSLEDPAKRAQIAISLFGEELAGRILPELNGRFAASSKAVDDWALSMDNVSRNQIYVLRRDMQNLKSEVLSLGTGFQAFGERASQGIAVAAAKTYDFLGRVKEASAFLLANPAGQAIVDSRGRAASVSDGEISQILQLALQRQQGKSSDSAFGAIASGADFGAIKGFGSTKEGLEASLSTARARQSGAISALAADHAGPNAGELTDSVRNAYAASLTASTREIARSEASLKVINDRLEAQQKALAERAAEPGRIAELNHRVSQLGIDSPIAKAADQADFEIRQLPKGASGELIAAAHSAGLALITAAIRKEQKDWADKYIDEEGTAQEQARSLIDKRFSNDITSRIAGGERLQVAAERNRTSINADDSQTFAGVRATADHFSRMTNLAARPGEEVAALREALTLRQDGLSVERAIIELAGDRYDQTREMARLDREDQDARWKLEESLQELRNRNIASYRESVVRGFDDIISGHSGNILKSFGVGIERQIIGNLADISYSTIQKATAGLHIGQSGTLAKLLNGTPFGPDPLKGSASALDLSADKLSLAADKLMSTGGVPLGGAGSAGSIFGGATNNPFIFNNQDSEDGIVGNAPRGPFAPDAIMTGKAPSGFDKSSLSKYGAAAVGAGVGTFAAIQGFSKGGASGALEGSAGIAAVASTLLPLLSKSLALAGPIGAIAGLGLGLVSSLFGHSKEKREQEITKALAESVYHAPTALDVTQDTSGRYMDRDRFGKLRTSPFSGMPQTSDPYTYWGPNNTPYEAPGKVDSPFGPQQVTINIHTLDAQSFQDFAQRNHSAFADAVATNLQTSESRLAASIRYIVPA